MKEEVIRIAIAEACGVKCRLCQNTGLYKKYGPHEWARVTNYKKGPEEQPLVTCPHDNEHFRTLPDYPNDLNAMHEAENQIVQAGGTYIDYIDTLNRVSEVDGVSMIWHATARQRAESFLRAINKWTDHD